MSRIERYKDASSFRASLQDRLRQSASGKDAKWLVRRRKFMVFDRLLARLMVVAPDRWLLKGAVALDFRLGERARATIDLDLYMAETETAAMADLVVAQSLDIGDFFVFYVERTDKLDALVDGIAVRYRIRAELDGRKFEQVTLDVGFDQYIAGAPDLLTGPDFFAFAGIAPIQIPTLPLAQHVAEKLHAYTRIYNDGRRSTRVKDLVDLVLIADNSGFEAERLRQAIEETFAFRGTQDVPQSLPNPPEDWRRPYRTLASDTGLAPDIDSGHDLAARFLDPVLSLTVPGSAQWSPENGVWR